jgi:4-methyl-5(b-hydroxyethyl)-thiazole monophosphate biosynthesis
MPGAEHLRDSKDLELILKQQKLGNRYYAAICASPAIVLQHHGLLDSIKATAYPDFANLLSNPDSTGINVVIDGSCITSRGPGTALEFSLKLVEVLCGKKKSDSVARAMLATYSFAS